VTGFILEMLTYVVLMLDTIVATAEILLFGATEDKPEYVGLKDPVMWVQD
jgi:hypothetical protein